MADVTLDEIKELYQQFMQTQGAQGGLATQYGQDVGAAYGAAAQPYQPSTTSKVAGIGGLVAAGAAAAGVGGRGARPMLGLLAGAGTGYARGQEQRFGTERERTLQNRLGQLSTQYGAESAALGARGEMLETGISAYETEQERMAAEEKAALVEEWRQKRYDLDVRREDRLSEIQPTAARMPPDVVGDLRSGYADYLTEQKAAEKDYLATAGAPGTFPASMTEGQFFEQEIPHRIPALQTAYPGGFGPAAEDSLRAEFLGTRPTRPWGATPTVTDEAELDAEIARLKRELGL